MRRLARLFKLPGRRPPPATARRLLGDEASPRAEFPGALPDKQADTLPAELIVPATRTLALAAEVPQGFSDARLREHLPQWLEDRWQGGAAPAVALGPRLADGRRVVFCADAAALEADLVRCRAGGGRPLRLRPAAELLPADDDILHVSLDPRLGRCARHGAHTFLALDQASPPVALRLHLAGQHAPAPRPRELVLLGDEAAEATDLAAWSAALGLPCRHAAGWRWQEVAEAAPVADFLHDRRLQRHAAGQAAPGRGIGLARLRPAAALLLVAALLAAAGEAAYGWRLATAQRALQTEMAGAFRAAFPEQPTVVDPLRQARRQLDELRAGRGEDDFTAAFAAFATLFSVSTAAGAPAPLGPGSVERIVWCDHALRVRLAGERAADAGNIAAALGERTAGAVRAEAGELLIGGAR